MSSFIERYDSVMKRIDIMREENTARLLRLREEQLVFEKARNIYDMQVTVARVDSVDFDNRWCKLVEELDAIGRESFAVMDSLIANCGVLDESDD